MKTVTHDVSWPRFNILRITMAERCLRQTRYINHVEQSPPCPLMWHSIRRRLPRCWMFRAGGVEYTCGGVLTTNGHNRHRVILPAIQIKVVASISLYFHHHWNVAIFFHTWQRSGSNCQVNWLDKWRKSPNQLYQRHEFDHRHEQFTAVEVDRCVKQGATHLFHIPLRAVPLAVLEL